MARKSTRNNATAAKGNDMNQDTAKKPAQNNGKYCFSNQFKVWSLFLLGFLVPDGHCHCATVLW
jgi:hypothetical protein